jgi:fibronectin type 3 domain-containing protein
MKLRFFLAACLFLAGAAAQAQSYQVDLSWTAPDPGSDPAAGYNVYRTIDGANTYSLLNTAGIDTSVTYVDDTVSNGVDYDYTVTSVDSSGNESTPTSPIFVAIPSGSPTPNAPTGLSFVQSGLTVTLSWTAAVAGSDAAAGYNIYRSVYGAYSYTLLNSGAIDTLTTYADTSVPAGNGYTYEVKSVDSSGNLSAPAVFIEISIPNAPSSLSFIESEGSVALSWAGAVSGGDPAAGYNIYRSVYGDNSYALLNSSGIDPSTAYTDAAPSGGQEYSYEVETVDALGGLSLPVVSGQAEIPNAPTVPLFTQSGTTVALSWTAAVAGADAAAGYNIYRSIYGDYDFELLNTEGVDTSAAYSDTDVPSGQGYSYEVGSVDASGNSSAPAVFGEVTLPNPVTGLSFTQPTGAVALTWSDVAGNDAPAGYNIYRSAWGADSYALLNSSGLDASAAYTDSTVLTGHDYSYEVIAVDAAGALSVPAFSSEASVPNVEASGLSLAQSGSSMVLSWGAPSDSPASANIYRSTLWGAYERIATGVTPDGPYTDSTVTPGLWFYFVTFSSNSGVESRWSNIASLVLTP